MHDDRLLQNTIISERLVTRVKRVESPRRHIAEKLLPKRAEVAPVTVAPRRYCYHLSAAVEETCRKSEECRVHVACLNADGAEEQSRSRSAVDLKIRRVEYDAVVAHRFRRKTEGGRRECFRLPSSAFRLEYLDAVLDKVHRSDTIAAYDSGSFACSGAAIECPLEVRHKVPVDLVRCDVDLLRGAWPRAHGLHPRRRQRSYARARVKQAQTSGVPRPKQRRHEACDRGRSEI